MKKFRKTLSLILIFTFIATLLNGITIYESGADELITLTVEKDSHLQDQITDTSAKLKWNQIAGAKSYLISYREYAEDNIGVAREVYADSPALTYEITGLVPDVVYNFTIEAKDDYTGTGNTLASDRLNLITASTFSCSYIPDAVQDSNGARESGANPGLKLEWRLPKIWSVTNFVYLENDMIDYKITVGTDKNASNSGLYKIIYNGSEYEVFKENPPVDTKLGYAPVSITNGRISYEWRYKNPLTDEINDAALKSGTIYYMRLVPQFSSTVDNVKYRISGLQDGYAYTPLHVKIGKDSNNNIICTVYRINYNSENNPEIINFKYEVYSSPDENFASPTLEGYEYEQYGEPDSPIEIFLPRKDRTATFYYKVLAKSDNMDNIASAIIDYNMANDVGSPSIPQHVSVDGIEAVSQTIGGSVVKSSDVTLKWDKPAEFQHDRANIKYRIFLSSAQEDLTTAGGVYYTERIDNAEYDIRYREIKTVMGDSANIDLSQNGFIKYTLKGMELFADDDGTPLANSDNYPSRLWLNKIYYTKIYAERVDTGASSDFSVPISFTTPAENLLKPPVPELFNINRVEEDEIQLAWRRTQIDVTDYDVPADTLYSVAYEIYMNDSIEKDANGEYKKPFLFAGSTNNQLHTAFSDGSGDAYNVRYAMLNNFTGNDEFTARFNNSIKPNTAYYFIIRTKLQINGEPEPRYSEFSNVLSATTKRGDIIEPPDQDKVPKAPIDFGVDVDENGNPKIESYTAVLKWTKQEENITYKLIRTSKPVDSDADADIEEISLIQGINLTEYILPQALAPDSVGKYVYAVQDLVPNTMYFFSIRAERQAIVNGQAEVVPSKWITLPVTTYLIEAPDSLSFLRDGSYNAYTQLKIQWKAKENFDFEIWVKREGQTEYSRWTDFLLTSDKPSNLTGTNFRMYYAVIRGLVSNTKYDIKVRDRLTRIVSGVDTADVSKFAGPITSRTEFRQSDYDNDQREKEEELIFNEAMNELRNGFMWLLTNTTSETCVKLRASQIINTMSHDNTNRFIINIGGLEKESDEKIILIPLSLIEYMNKNKEILVIRSSFGELAVTPESIEASNYSVLFMKNKAEQSKSSIEDVLIRINLEKISESSSSIPSTMKDTLVSEVIDLSGDVLGLSETEEDIETLVHKRLEDILERELDDFKDESSSKKDTAQEIRELLNKYREDIIEEIGDYLDSRINDGSSFIKDTVEMTEFSNPIQLKFNFNPFKGQNYYTAYRYADKEWEKLGTSLDYIYNTAVFEVKKPAAVGIFKNNSTLSSNDKTKTEALNRLDLKYDISSIVKENGVFRGTDPITLNQMLGVAGKILGEEYTDESELGTRISAKLGLNNPIKQLANAHKLTKEEAVYILIKLYGLQTGVTEENYTPAIKTYPSDQRQINPAYYKSILLAVDLKLISPDRRNKLLPKTLLSKEDVLVLLYNVLELCGEF